MLCRGYSASRGARHPRLRGPVRLQAAHLECLEASFVHVHQYEPSKQEASREAATARSMCLRGCQLVS
jgi:hypothetical protein